MKFLNKLLNIKIPELPVEDVKPVVDESTVVPADNPVIAMVGFIIHKDGNISVKTEWIHMSPSMATVYAKLMYEINTGGLEESMHDMLMQYGSQHVQSQEFIELIVTKYKELISKYKMLPIISPSLVLKGKDAQ